MPGDSAGCPVALVALVELVVLVRQFRRDTAASAHRISTPPFLVAGAVDIVIMIM